MRVWRTLVYLKPDVVIFLDLVSLRIAQPVQVRFQLYNEDGGGQLAVRTGEFTLTRPRATLLGRVALAEGVTLHAGRLPLEPQDGEQQFAEVVSAAATEHAILTVCTARPAGKDHGKLVASRESDGWRVTGEHDGQKVDVLVRCTGMTLPVVTF